MTITIVDKSPHFEWIPNNFMTLTQDEWKENHIQFTDAMASYKSPRVSFIQARLTKVVDEKQVELAYPDGKSGTLEYDVLLLTTGSSYNSPWRAADDKIPTTAEREEEYRKVREDIKAASSVLCVGAGPAGVEAAGWIKEVYPEKTVGICMRGDKILARFNNAHAVAEGILKKIGVECHYNVNYSEGAAVKTAAGSNFEYVLDCRGFKYNGPKQYL